MRSIARSIVSFAVLAALAACSGNEGSVLYNSSVKRKVSTAKIDPLAMADAVKVAQPPRNDDVQDSRALLERLPKEALVVLRFPHVESLKETWERTSLRQKLEHPLIAAALAQTQEIKPEQALAQLLKQAPELQQLVAIAPKLQGELLLALTGVNPAAANGEAPISGQVLFDVRHGLDELKQAFEPLLAKSKRNVVRKVGVWGFTCGDESFAIDAECEGSLLSVMFGPPALLAGLRAEAEDFSPSRSFVTSELARATPDLGAEGERIVLETYINIAPLMQLAKLAAPPEVLAIMRSTGLLRLEGFSLSVALGDEGISEAVTWCSPGLGDLLSRVLTAKPLDRSLARWVPADVEHAGLYAIDVSGLFAEVQALLPADVRKEMQSELDDLRRYKGLDLRADLFENIGPTIGWASSGDFGSWMERGWVPFCMFVQVRDARKLERLIDGALLYNEAQARVQRKSIGAYTMCSLEGLPPENGKPMSLCWAVTDNCLLAGTDVKLLESCLAAGKRAETAHTGLAEALERADEKSWSVSSNQGSEGLPRTVGVGRATPNALILEARNGSGAVTLESALMSLGVVSGVAIPKLLVARSQANEQAAISSLRALTSAQAQLQSAGVVDTDGDGVGEYGGFGELTGAKPCRIQDGEGPGMGMAGVDTLNPPVLSASFAAVQSSQVVRSGYCYQIFLPAKSVEKATRGIAEDPEGGFFKLFPDADNGEVLWCAYAWPVSAGQTGKRAFFVNQEGDILESPNRGNTVYSGLGTGPMFDAAFSVAGDMGSPLGIDGKAAADGSNWTVVH